MTKNIFKEFDEILADIDENGMGFLEEIYQEVSSELVIEANQLKKIMAKQKRQGKTENYLICKEIIAKKEKNIRILRGEITDEHFIDDIKETLF